MKKLVAKFTIMVLIIFVFVSVLFGCAETDELAKFPVASIEVISFNPSYLIGESFPSDATLRVVFKEDEGPFGPDNKTKLTSMVVEITPNMVTGFSTASYGKRNIVVSYAGYEEALEITVDDEIIGIVIDAKTWKGEYEVGELMGVGQKFIAHFRSGYANTFDLLEYEVRIKGFDTKTEGEREMTIEFRGHQLTRKYKVIKPTNNGANGKHDEDIQDVQESVIVPVVLDGL
ncbi:MAG: hypothetical protein LBE09_05410 [Christensenellaceae bacterium]|jgi:hypothetical protein|nr:hypothetical protein [Christensenellaceae bacterium]